MIREECGEDCRTVFLENTNVNYTGSPKKLYDEHVIPPGIQVRLRLRNDKESGCFRLLASETLAWASDRAPVIWKIPSFQK